MERHFFLAGQRGEDEFEGNNDDNFEWDVASETWIRRKSMPLTRGHASSSTTPVDCGFIISGGSSNGRGGIRYVVGATPISDTSSFNELTELLCLST